MPSAGFLNVPSLRSKLEMTFGRNQTSFGNACVCTNVYVSQIYTEMSPKLSIIPINLIHLV